MNKKQQIILWTGIVIIVLICLFPPQYSWRSGSGDLFSSGGWGGGRKTDTGRLIGYLVAVSVVTGGMIYTFRDKRAGEKNNNQRIISRKKFDDS